MYDLLHRLSLSRSSAGILISICIFRQCTKINAGAHTALVTLIHYDNEGHVKLECKLQTLDGGHMGFVMTHAFFCTALGSPLT